MSNTPSDEELNSVLCHHWPAFSMQAVLVQMWLRDAMRAALAKWGTPQPVAREPLTDEQLAEMMRDTWGCASIAPRHAMMFARAIEAEVRKQDDALIRQMLEAIEAETYDIWDCYRYHPKLHDAAVAARARLGEKT